MKYDLILKVLRQIAKIVMYRVNKKTICNIFKNLMNALNGLAFTFHYVLTIYIQFIQSIRKISYLNLLSLSLLK